MVRIAYVLILLFVCAGSFGEVRDSSMGGKIEWDSVDSKVAGQCGFSVRVPRLLDVFDHSIGFGCTGSYKGEGTAILNMGIEYDPNQGAGGSNIGFVIQSVGISKKIAAEGDSIFRNSTNGVLPSLWSGVAYKVSNCGSPTTVSIMPISGENWHGWLAEESFGKPPRGCKLVKEYSPAFRCVHLMIGNEKMVAQLGGVCLLRKKEYSLKNGFSYDLFVDMVKSIRFNEG
jgi:hypothetical protein